MLGLLLGVLCVFICMQSVLSSTRQQLEGNHRGAVLQLQSDAKLLEAEATTNSQAHLENLAQMAIKMQESQSQRDKARKELTDIQEYGGVYHDSYAAQQGEE